MERMGDSARRCAAATLSVIVGVAGCAASEPPPSASPASTASPPSSSSAFLDTPAPRPATAQYESVLDEALSAPSLELTIDSRVVGLTGDDFLPGHRRERGTEIVGGGTPPWADFWFVLGDQDGVASAAWVELARVPQPEGLFAYPTEPLANFIEIVQPGLPPEERDALHEHLRIGEGHIVHPPETDIEVESRGVIFHVVADANMAYLVGTRTNGMQ